MPKKRRAMPGRRTAPGGVTRWPSPRSPWSSVSTKQHPMAFFWGGGGPPKKGRKSCERDMPGGFDQFWRMWKVTCIELWSKTPTVKLGPTPKAEGDTKLQCRSVRTAAATAKTARPMRLGEWKRYGVGIDLELKSIESIPRMSPKLGQNKLSNSCSRQILHNQNQNQVVVGQKLVLCMRALSYCFPRTLLHDRLFLMQVLGSSFSTNFRWVKPGCPKKVVYHCVSSSK